MDELTLVTRAEGLEFILEPHTKFVLVFLLFIYYAAMKSNILLLISIFFIFNTNSSYSQPIINKTFTNIVIHKKPKDLPVLKLKNRNKKMIIFSDFSSKVTLINFWATWCAPCRVELPKLKILSSQVPSDQLNIILVNIENKNNEDIDAFFKEIRVTNFENYFDDNLKLTKQLSLRGIPITLIVNSKGKEVARIIGDLDFTDKRFALWINSF